MFALSSLLASGIALFLGSFVFHRNPRKALNRVFLIYCLSAAYYAFTEFGYRQAESVDTAYFWWKVGAFWPFTVSLILHFTLIFTEKSQLLKGKFTYFLIYAPALMFSLMELTTNLLTTGLIKVYWGWTNSISESPLYTVAVIWAFFIGFLSIYLCWRYYLKTTERVKKQRAKYVLIGGAFPLAMAFITEGILFYLAIRVPELSTIGFAIGSIFLGYAVWKYELFALTPATAAESILATMTDALLLVSPEGRIVTVNQAVLGLLGYEESELIEQPLEIIFAQEETPFAEIHREKLATNASVTDLEAIFKTKDGRRIPISLTGSTMRDEDGIEWGIIYVGRDLTERKQAEEELRTHRDNLGELVKGRTAELRAINERLQREVIERRRAEKELKHSEQRLKILFELAPAAYYLNDLRGNFVDGNKAAEDLVGYKREELIGKNFLKLELLPPNQIPKAAMALAKNVLGQPTGPDEFILNRKDGGQVVVEIRTFPVKIEGQTLVLGVARDITERKQAEEMLRKAYSELGKRVQERTAELAEANEVLRAEIAEHKRTEKALRRAEAEARRRLKEQTALREAGAVITSTLDLADVLGRIAEQMGRAIDVTSAYICTSEPESGASTVLAEYIGPHACAEERVSDLGDIYVDTDVGFLEALRAGRPSVDHVDDLDLVQYDREHMQRYGAKSVLYIPLYARSQAIGYAELWESRRRREFTAEEIALCQAIAQNATVAVENARLYEQARQELAERKQAEAEAIQRNRELLTLQAAGVAITSSLDLQYVLSTVAREMANLLGVEACAISGWDQATDTVSLLAEYGPDDWWDEGAPNKVFALSDYPLTKRVLTERRAQWMPINQPDIDPAELAFMQEAAIKTLLMLPMVFQDRAVGLVEIEDWRERAFTDQEIALAQLLANQAASAIENARLYEEARQELAERRRAEEALRKSEEKYRDLVENINDIIYATDEEGVITYISPFIESLSGYSVSEIVGRSFTEFIYQEDLPRIMKQFQEAISGHLEPGEYRISTKSGEIRWVCTSSRPVFTGERVTGLRGVMTDITERKRAEEQIKASLREKEVLLKEIHHRVKNNLQVISSLLYLQSKGVEDKETLEIFLESQNRVRSMALVHEKLYQSRGLARIHFAEYIQSLADYLFQSYRVNSNVIKLNINICEVSVGINTAIPCGLIVNELVTNSLKHAFPDGREGEIHVEFHSDDDNKFTLLVSDNGVGFPQDADYRDMESLGLQLVNTLANQLEATIELDRSSGTAFKITFAAST